MPKRKKTKELKKSKLDDVVLVTSITLAILTLCFAIIFMVLRSVKSSNEQQKIVSDYFSRENVLGAVDTSVQVGEFCGNSVREGSEECDGSDLDGESCISKGFDGGALGCKADCTFDTSNCTECGNGVKESGEQCDGSDLNSKTCKSLGFDGGSLSCRSNCNFNTSQCTYDDGEQTTTTTTAVVTTSTATVSTSTTITSDGQTGGDDSQTTTTGTKDKNKDTDGDGIPDFWENNFTCVDYLVEDADLDYDDDGLDNYDEYIHNCNPCLLDTDNDGLPDEWEIENSLDPNLDDSSWDPDNDGYSNLEEYLNKTDPKRTDKEEGIDLPTTGEDESLVRKWLLPMMIILLGFGAGTVLVFIVLKNKSKV